MIELLFGSLLSESSVNEHEQPKNATAQVIKQTKAVLYIFKKVISIFVLGYLFHIQNTAAAKVDCRRMDLSCSILLYFRLAVNANLSIKLLSRNMGITENLGINIVVENHS
mgnify:CR=1 FL=1